MRHCVVVCGLLLGICVTPAMAGKQITVTELEALRVVGTAEVVPDAEFLDAVDVGHDVLSVTVKVCLDARGKVTSAERTRSSGILEFDSLVVLTVKETWRFRPYKRKKKAIAVCGPAVVTYQPSPPPPPPPPPPPAADPGDAPTTARPKVVAVSPTALEATRISGNKNILPDDQTKVEIQKAGKHRLVIPIKICLDTTGAVKSVSMLKSSGFPRYDAKIRSAMRSWTYQPFLVDGVAAPVCSAIVIIYVQKG